MLKAGEQDGGACASRQREAAACILYLVVADEGEVPYCVVCRVRGCVDFGRWVARGGGSMSGGASRRHHHDFLSSRPPSQCLIRNVPKAGEWIDQRSAHVM
jgi:hypothetical protein